MQLILKTYLIVLCLTFGIGTGWGETCVDYVFYESFDGHIGTGGNDGKWSGSIATRSLKSENYDNSGWMMVTGYAANKCVRLGSSTILGYAQTPTINASGNLTLTFKAGAWIGKNKNLKLSATNATLDKSFVTMTNDGSFTEFTVNIVNASDGFRIKFEGNSKNDSQFFLDEVKITNAAPLGTATITLNSACHDDWGMVYASYSNDKAWVVPADLTVEEIGVKDNGRLTLRAYATGAVVPANTGVMVSASAQSVEETKGNYTVNISNEQGSSVLGSENRLRPASNITAGEMAAKDPNCLYYRLTMHNGTQIGYWWGAENGAAFAITAPNKAYLAVPESQMDAIKYLGIWLDDDASCIDAVKCKGGTSGVAYNLAGQRVTADAKGIAIVNGKKLFNK